MQQVVRLARFAFTSHFVRYVFVGITTFAIDFGLLFLLHGVIGVNLVIATSIAYWCSIIYNFSLNRWWTFDNKDLQNLQRNLFGYIVLLVFNYAFTVLFVRTASHSMNYGFAKVLAVGIQICWTFPAYKYFIFAKKERTDTT